MLSDAYEKCLGIISIHLIFVTKYRQPVISDRIESRLQAIVKKLCASQECKLLECKPLRDKENPGPKDHIYLQVELSPKTALSRLVNTIKTITSREIRKEFQRDLDPYYGKERVLWEPGYGFTSASYNPLQSLQEYVESIPFIDKRSIDKTSS